MESCCNCSCAFKKKKGGFYRHSLDLVIQSSGLPAKEHLSEICGSTLSPTKRSNKFLCPQCWTKLNETVKYKDSLNALFECTASTSYVAGKRSTDPHTPSFTKRPRFTSTPLKKASISTHRRGSKWDSIITAIRARQYSRAISGLYNATNGSRRSFAEFVCRLVRKEVNALLKKEITLCQKVTIPNLANFSWDSTIKESTASAPVLLSCLKGAVTTKFNKDTLIKGSRNKINLKPRIGTALSVLLYSRSPHNFNFLPTLMSVQFWRGRLKRETLKQISRLGLCVGYEATLSAIDRVRADFDSVALKCKADIENILQNKIVAHPGGKVDDSYTVDLSVSLPTVDDEIAQYPEMEDTILYSENDLINESMEQILDDDGDEDVDVDDDDDDTADTDAADDDDDDDDDDSIIVRDNDNSNYCEIPDVLPFEIEGESVQDVAESSAMDLSVSPEMEPRGFTMCWDNVGKKVISRHPTEIVKNQYLNMALGYIAINRVKPINADWREENLTKATDIPIERFIPQSEDFDRLRYRMVVLVGRIISKHIPWFQSNFSECTTPHIVHEFSNESARKSVIVNLGVFDEDPCSTQGAIGIYEKLHKYVPVVDNVPVKTVVFGDGLSCERGNDAQRARSNGLTPAERLEGLEPAAQEFHKEMLLLQDFYDTFYKGTSASDRGTLCQVKNFFNFRQVKSDIADNFSHSWELMCTVVESYICLLVMSMLKIEVLTNRPKNAPVGIENAAYTDKSTYFETICKSVVERVWRQLDTDLLIAREDDSQVVICCGEEFDDDMIGCESRSACTKGEFFHYSCVGIEPEDRDLLHPWYCSEECRQRVVEPYQYCVCGEDLGGDIPMIGCSSENLCTNKEWYHMHCIGIDPKAPPKGKWFCSDECKKQSSSKKKISHSNMQKADLVKEYSESLIWAGLNLLCRRDAVREADGEAMISFWRLDLVHFFANKHPKYTILTHRLLAAISGWMPDRIKFDLINNRTVNYGGGIGRNLPLDFMNEILNRLFKDLLESAKGRYTDTTVHRSSQIIGPLSEALDHVFDCNIVENEFIGTNEEHKIEIQTFPDL